MRWRGCASSDQSHDHLFALVRDLDSSTLEAKRTAYIRSRDDGFLVDDLQFSLVFVPVLLGPNSVFVGEDVVRHHLATNAVVALPLGDDSTKC